MGKEKRGRTAKAKPGLLSESQVSSPIHARGKYRMPSQCAIFSFVR
jgi:hypothetical protein